MFAQTMPINCRLPILRVKDTAVQLRMPPIPSQSRSFPLLDRARSDLSCLLLAGCPLIKPVELCFTLRSL